VCNIPLLKLEAHLRIEKNRGRLQSVRLIEFGCFTNHHIAAPEVGNLSLHPLPSTLAMRNGCDGANADKLPSGS
jgi:hypothetical protein